MTLVHVCLIVRLCGMLSRLSGLVSDTKLRRTALALVRASTLQMLLCVVMLNFQGGFSVNIQVRRWQQAPRTAGARPRQACHAH